MAETEKKAAASATSTSDAGAATATSRTGPRVKWDTTNLKSSYANVCNVTSTREEVVLNFGINQDWDRGAAELEVQLTDRIIMSPFAAKRLTDMLNKLMSEYQSRYGSLAQPSGGSTGIQ
jgi:hypothetical protein